MKWIDAHQIPPTSEDSPILAASVYEDSFNIAALHYIEGWDGAGWYDHYNDYGMKSQEINWWMPLPIPPKKNPSD